MNFHFDSQQVAELWEEHISWWEGSTQGPACLTETKKSQDQVQGMFLMI